MAVEEKLSGKTKFIATKVVATPDGTPPPFYRIAEVYFPSLQALQACAESAGCGIVAHAVKISSGGAPSVSGRRRANVYFWRQFVLGTPENAGVPRYITHGQRSHFVDPLTSSPGGRGSKQAIDAWPV